MNQVQKGIVSFHISLALFSIMVGILLFVFEHISQAQILTVALLCMLFAEFLYFVKTRLFNAKPKPSASHR